MRGEARKLALGILLVLSTLLLVLRHPFGKHSEETGLSNNANFTEGRTAPNMATQARRMDHAHGPRARDHWTRAQGLGPGKSACGQGTWETSLGPGTIRQVPKAPDHGCRRHQTMGQGHTVPGSPDSGNISPTCGAINPLGADWKPHRRGTLGH